MVATITRGIDAHLLVDGLYAHLAFRRGELHPSDISKVALELRIFERLAGNGVVIVVLPVTVLRTFHTVLPHTIRTFAYPLLALYLLLGIVKADTHQIDHAVEVIFDIHIQTAVAKEAVGYLL